MNIALLELTTWHEECLYSQIKFLKDSGYKVTLVIHPKLKVQIAEYEHLLDRVVLLKTDSSVFFLKRLYQVIKLLRKLIKGNYEKVVFNTASSKKEIIFLSYFLTKKRVQCFGVLHNLKKSGS